MRRTLNALTTKLAGQVKTILNILAALMMSVVGYGIGWARRLSCLLWSYLPRWRPAAEAPTPKATTAATDNHALTDAQRRNANRFGQPNGVAKQSIERNRQMKKALTTKLAGRSKPFLNWELAGLLCIAFATFGGMMWLASGSFAHNNADSDDTKKAETTYAEAPLYVEHSGASGRGLGPYYHPSNDWAMASAKGEADAVHKDTFPDMDRRVYCIMRSWSSATANGVTDPDNDYDDGYLIVIIRKVMGQTTYETVPMHIAAHSNTGKVFGGTAHQAKAFAKATLDGSKGRKPFDRDNVYIQHHP